MTVCLTQNSMTGDWSDEETAEPLPANHRNLKEFLSQKVSAAASSGSGGGHCGDVAFGGAEARIAMNSSAHRNVNEPRTGLGSPRRE